MNPRSRSSRENAPGTRNLHRRSFLAGTDWLERRELLAIVPGQVYQDVTYTDSDGDSVRITITGPVTDPVNQGFTVDLAGLATDDADATYVNLIGLGAANGLQIVVTPVLQPNAGPNFNAIYSAGYTNVFSITAEPEPGHIVPAMTNLGGIQLSAAIVHKIDLPGIGIGNVTLDPGQAPYVDRINTTNNQQSLDSTMYMPVTGLIDLGGIEAASIDTLVIDGAISALTGNPYDVSVTNDFKSVINVSGRIGSILGLRSNMGATVYADSVGTVRVASFSGVVHTRNSAESFNINMPSSMSGFIDVAGHLNIGFPMSGAALITGQISAGGGISGLDKTSQSDTLYIAGGFANSLTNTSTTTGIANIEVDGIATLSLYSASTVGNISANAFGGDFLVESATSIGNILASSGIMAGHLQAGTNIGDIKTTGGIVGTMIAGGNIGKITVVNGSLESLSIQAGGNVGPMSIYLGLLATSIVAGGDIGQIDIPVGGISLSYLRATNIAGIKVVDGGFENSSFVAGQDIGPISVFGSIEGFGMSDVSLVAGRDIAPIDARAHTGYAMEEVKIEAGRRLAGVTAISYGEFGELDGSGILESNFVAASMGPILGRSVGGTGIEASVFVTRTGSIDALTGDGWLDGMLEVVAVAQFGIGSITGKATVEGSGFLGGSFDANYGSIGSITAAGGAVAGYGIDGTRFQSTDRFNGGIGDMTVTVNANGQGGISAATIHAAKLGHVFVTAFGGQDADGIADSEIRTFWGPIASLDVDVRSVNGYGIRGTTVRSSGDIELIRVISFGNSAIFQSDFTSRGDFGPIAAEARKGGNGIDTSTFTAPNGSIASGSKIQAYSGGTDAAATAIYNSTFKATQSIGIIEASTLGGPAIDTSTFTADSDLDNTGAIEKIDATSGGRNLDSSRGISDSTFTGVEIGPIEVEINTVEGGTAIASSTFTAKSDFYDGFGNFDNKGRIGDISVSSISGFYHGIDDSTFDAGSAGGIGAITVTTEGGVAIRNSNFRATTSDADQNLFTSTIGPIAVTTSRYDNATSNMAGIVGSTFEANAGIVSITVNSVGGAISDSTFNADADYLGLGDIPGNIGSIRVTVPGRNANGVVNSTFTGGSIGNISVRLADNALTAQDAIRGSQFTALRNSIGNVTVVNTGSGYATIDTIFRAAISIGAINITGAVSNTQFIIFNSTIGNILIVGSQISNLFFQAQNFGSIELILTSGGTAMLSMPNAVRMGNLNVSGPLGGTAGLNWNAPTLVTAGDVNVSGMLTPVSNMTSLTTMGNFIVGSIAQAPVHTGRTIGAGASGSSIGAVRIGQAASGKTQNSFRFGSFLASPNAVVGTASGNAKTGQGAVIGNVRFVATGSGARTTATKAKSPKPKALPKVSKVVGKRAGGSN